MEPSARNRVAYSAGKVAVEPTDDVHRFRSVGTTDLESR